MKKKGRPRIGAEARTKRLTVCVEPRFHEAIERLARESRRSVSDYCGYVLEEHVKFTLDLLSEPPPPPPDSSTDTRKKEPEKRPEVILEVGPCYECLYPLPYHHETCSKK